VHLTALVRNISLTKAVKYRVYVKSSDAKASKCHLKYSNLYIQVQ